MGSDAAIWSDKNNNKSFNKNNKARYDTLKGSSGSPSCFVQFLLSRPRAEPSPA